MARVSDEREGLYRWHESVMKGKVCIDGMSQ